MAADWPKNLTVEDPPPATTLLALVDRLRSETPNSRLGVGGTWTSPKQDAVPLDLWPITDAILAALPAGVWDTSWWANVLRPGDALDWHDHRHSHRGGENAYAAVYYVQVDGGLFLIGGVVPERVEPVPGMLVVFPADMPHAVPAWQGAGERISLAFNVRAAG